MARVSFLFVLLAALATISNAFAPAPAFGCVTRPETALPVKIKIVVGDGEPIESAIRRFKREVSKSGHLIELRHKRYFENSQERAKRKVKEARMRKKFERMQKRRTANRV
ncbi:hypothetical protein FisN_11Lh219 [Fistulifera solaris]|uniref:Small subunit ribosomal protein S21 n=1 Tax=Fistulifera solaris TaxID=1519565 RepID=A0A1Z5J736_FISSO|nr:hypothetical protein FisN_11Lh219 [Fistulifera solaris]|eukprot:GAX09807.1 hypothetical protein FisN_11Lh219 [Fistulifera solaris]